MQRYLDQIANVVAQLNLGSQAHQLINAEVEVCQVGELGNFGSPAHQLIAAELEGRQLG